MYQNWALTQSTRTAKAGSVQLSQHIAAHFPASMEPAKSYIPIYVDLFLHATIYKVGTTKNSMVKKKNWLAVTEKLMNILLCFKFAF